MDTGIQTSAPTDPTLPPPRTGGPNFQLYMNVFYALCVLTAVSFLANLAFGQGTTSAGIIMIVAVIKATLVGAIFMHLSFDWSKLYGIIIPVAILGVMMLIILSIDQAVVWHQPPARIDKPIE